MEKNLRALIVEDSEDDALLLAHHLASGGYKIDWRRVETAPALTAALAETPWDIIFADFSMPQFSGVAALTLVRQRGLDIPLIFVSGTIGEDVAVMALKAGANDYIMKGNLKRLIPAVERELREAQLRHDQQRTQQEMQLLEDATRAGADASDVLSAMTATVRKMCESIDWDLAQVWFPRADGAAIACSPAWFCRETGVDHFRAASLGAVLAFGEGLPGAVWASQQPLWIDAIEHYADRRFAHNLALKTALGVPIMANDEVLAVLEFFRRAPTKEDSRVVRLFATVADQLGTIIQRKRAEERLHHMAHYDHLTGLPNRVLFTDRLSQAMVDAQRHRRVVGVIFLDLDRFKTINDSLGHGIGDLLLIGVARRLERSVRPGDTVARLAGDEFTIALADMAHIDDAAQVAQKLLDDLSQPLHVGGHELFTGASLGVTIFPSDDTTVEGLLRNADIAMYRAKDQGGNSFHFYSSDMTAKARARLSLENELRRAIEREELVLHYQPIVSLRGREVMAIEALVRWNHPVRGLLLPSEFIPLAEEAGLIMPLGEWVMHTALNEIRQFVRAGFVSMRVGVNISAHQFRQQEILRIVRSALAAADVPPYRLQLEITESVLMQNVEATDKTLRALREMDVELSLDDFGTGYSSLSYLKRFPIDVLKIDRSFVRDIPGDADDAAIASAIISMAHTLGIAVVAEGVESREQLEFLRERGCDQVQGYYFSHPLPANLLNQLLSEDSRLSPFIAAAPNDTATLLVLDDDSEVVSTIAAVAKSDGYRMIVADSADKVFDALEREQIGVVLCDQRVPTMGGVAFLAKLRRLYPSAICILMSAQEDFDMARQAINTGAVHKYLHKPWRPEELQAVLADAFAAHRAASGGARVPPR